MKVANLKLRKVRNFVNFRKIIPSFLFSEFSILPYSQNWKLRFKNLGKQFSRFPRLSRFPSFQSRCIIILFSTLPFNQRAIYFLHSLQGNIFVNLFPPLIFSMKLAGEYYILRWG